MRAGRGILLLAVATVVAGVVAWFWSDGRPDTPPLATATVLKPALALPRFRLVDQDGRPFDRDSLTGHWSLVFFGFTHCGDVCPLTLHRLDLVTRDLARPPAVVFVSVDPGRDTPEQIRRFVRAYREDFTGATGEVGQIDRLTKAFAAYYTVTQDDQGYTVRHSAAVYLVDPQARLAALFSPPLKVASAAADLKVLMR